jgi:alkyl hydroperoxide reductase subunit AhpF
MTPQEKDKILSWRQSATIPSPFQLGRALADGDAGAALSSFADDLKTLLPDLRLKTEDPTTIPAPYLAIGTQIFYRAVPLERELPPFLEALSMDQAAAIAKEEHTLIHRLQVPLFLKVYIAPQCPYCPQVVANLIKVTKISPRIHLTIIDAALFPDEAARDDVKSVPVTILDDQFRWVGLFALKELLEMALDRDPSKLSPDSMQKMLESGEAETLADMMAAADQIFPGLIDLITHDKWPVRLGAMVAVEYIVEANGDLAAQLIDPLWKNFQHYPDPVKGDIIHLFEQFPIESVKPILEQILAETSNPELQEAAREALEG